VHIGRRYTLLASIQWSRANLIGPLLYSAAIVAIDLLSPLELGLPWLPVSAIAISVAFYLGFKNSASYDRLWEARKIWGAIVNASRSWAFGARDLVTTTHLPPDSQIEDEELGEFRRALVLRHVAWLDALRHQLRRVTTWEHQGGGFDRYRKRLGAAEYEETLAEVLAAHLPAAEVDEVMGRINPAAHLLANQSRQLAELRDWGVLDGFAHMQLQRLLDELMAQQGKAERIKNFPFPRQYATVNSFFAVLFAALVPFGLIHEFRGLDEVLVPLAIPFSTLISWVFLTTDQIGDWSENPFEGLHNDVPITAMSRGIQRDILEMIDADELPPAREPKGELLM